MQSNSYFQIILMDDKDNKVAKSSILNDDDHYSNLAYQLKPGHYTITFTNVDHGKNAKTLVNLRIEM